MLHMREHVVEDRLRDGIKEAGGRCVKLSPLGWVGIPDRLVLLPEGFAGFVELKKPRGGVLSKKQKLWGRWLYENGFDYRTLWTVEEVDEYVEAMVDRARRHR